MELDEMKLAWQALHGQVAQQQRLSRLILQESRLGRMQRGLRPLRVGMVIQMMAGAWLMLLAAPFWLAHRDSFHLLLCGVALHVYGLMCVLSAARNFFLIARIDYAAPVVEIQKRLAALRAWRMREALVFGGVGCFVWIPFTLMVFERLGADIWKHEPEVVWCFIACGVVCLGIMAGVIHWSRRAGSKWAASLVNASAVGRSVQNAQRALDEIDRFVGE